MFLVAKELNKNSDEVIKEMEEEDMHPRVSLLEDQLNMELLDERYLQNLPAYKRWLYKLLPMELVLIIEAWLIHEQYDVVISYYERVGLPFAYLQKLLGSGTPHILMTTWFSSAKKAWFLKRVHDSLAKILTWSSNQYQYAIEELGIPQDKIRLLKRGTDQKFWRPLNTDPHMICSAGMEMRDYPTLIEALQPLNIPCHIAAAMTARGQRYKTVDQLYDMNSIPANVTIGKKQKLALRNLYAQSHFVVVPLLPTDTDNGLTVILEAMAMGKPVICSRVEGQIDVIEEGVTGFYVPQGDPEALREAILELWNNPAKAKEMGQAARKYVERVHNLEQFVSDIKKEAMLATSEYTRLPQVSNLQSKVEV